MLDIDFQELDSSDEQKKGEIVRSLGIFELRGLARALGIKSPTTKVRDILIDDILTTLLTGKVPDPQKSRKGRPYKKLANLDSIVSLVAKAEAAKEDFSYEKVAVFNQEIPVFTTRGTNVERMSGVIRSGTHSSYFIDLRSNRRVFIDEEIIKSKGIVLGDYILCEAYKINDSNQFFVSKIFSINGIAFDKYSPKEPTSSKRVMPSTFITIGNMSVLQGGRNTMLTKSPLFLNDDLKELLYKLEKENAITIFVGVNMCFEDKFLVLGHKNIVSFITDYEDEADFAYDRIIDAINFASRLSVQERNVNFVLYDCLVLLSYLDKKFRKYMGKEHVAEAVVVFKKIISLALAKENDVCTTVIATCNEADKDDPVLKNEVLRAANEIVS